MNALHDAKFGGNSFSYTFNNDETHEHFAWKGLIEDGWVSAAPKSVGRGWHVGNGYSSLEGSEYYTIAVDGWFSAPRAGFYRFTSNGDDTHVVQFNSENDKCAVDRDALMWGETDNHLTSSGSAMTANKLHESDIVDGSGWNYRSISEQVFELEKGELFYLRGVLQEHNSVDFMQIGAIYLGDSFTIDETEPENRNYQIPQDVLRDERFFTHEKVKYEVQQTAVYDTQYLEITSNETVTSVEIFYNDGVRSRSVSFDPTETEEVIKNTILEGLFSTTCVYGDDILPYGGKLEYETGMIWPYNAPYKTDGKDSVFPNFQSKQPFCGLSYYESTPTENIGKSWFHKRFF